MRHGECRGWLITGVAAWADARADGALYTRASRSLAALLETPESRRADWVSTELLIEALLLSDTLFGHNDLGLCRGIGFYIAQREAGPVQALALRVLRPPILMSLAPSLWSTHFRDTARVTVRGRGDRDIVVSFSEAESPTRALCLAVGGWMEGWLALGQRSEIRVDHIVCRCEGATTCDYSVTWEE
jgi:hypothetical protein